MTKRQKARRKQFVHRGDGEIVEFWTQEVINEVAKFSITDIHYVKTPVKALEYVARPR